MTSGAIQYGDPTTVFRLFRVLVNSADTPKSASFTCPSDVSKTFPHLISRWHTFATPWRYSRPRTIEAQTARIQSSGNKYPAFASSKSLILPPSQNSITIHISPGFFVGGFIKHSQYPTMYGESQRLRMSISPLIFSSSLAELLALVIILTATTALDGLCCALYTAPKDPSPNKLRISSSHDLSIETCFDLRGTERFCKATRLITTSGGDRIWVE